MKKEELLFDALGEIDPALLVSPGTADGTEWDNSTDILKREVEYLGTLSKYKGVSVYCYAYFNYNSFFFFSC